MLKVFFEKNASGQSVGKPLAWIDAMHCRKVCGRKSRLVFRLILWCALFTCWFQFSVAAYPIVTLSWDPGSDFNIAGYAVYYGTSSHTYNQKLLVGKAAHATISGLTRGKTYYFAAATRDASGAESKFSNEVVYTVPCEPVRLTSALNLKGPSSCRGSGTSGLQSIAQTSNEQNDLALQRINPAPSTSGDPNITTGDRQLHNHIN